MVRWMLALVVTVSSLIGPRPCCCTLAIGHVHVETMEPTDQCCCGQHEHDEVTTLNDEPNVGTPPHRCRCDHSSMAEPMTVSKSESEWRLTVERQFEISDFGFHPFTISNSVSFADAEWHGPTGRALLRALHVMRC